MSSRHKHSVQNVSKKRPRDTSDIESDTEFPIVSIWAETSASNSNEQNKIMLEDPHLIVVGRRREDELRKCLNNPTEETITGHSPTRIPELQEFYNLIQCDLQKPEIKLFPPGKHTFAPKHLYQLFNKNTVPGKHQLSVKQNSLIENLVHTDTTDMDLLQYLFQSDLWNDDELKSVCEHIFYLISVHEDENIVHEGAACLLQTNFWHPTLKNILLVLLNWGDEVSSPLTLSSHTSVICSVVGVEVIEKLLDHASDLLAEGTPGKTDESTMSSSTMENDPESVFKTNFREVLKIVSMHAKGIMCSITENEQCLLLKLIINGVLDTQFIYSCTDVFRACITALVNAIPESQWNQQKVQKICRLIHREEHFHNLQYLCFEILTLYPRCEELGYALTSLTISHLMDIYWFDRNSLALVIKSKPFINKLNLYQLYIVIHLFFLLSMADKTANRNGNLLLAMIEWFRDIRHFVKNCFSSVHADDVVLIDELIARCMTFWRIEQTKAAKSVL